MPNDSFIDLYLDYTTETECPTFFHRWCALASLAAWLGRSVHFSFGHFNLYPNMYCILIGIPGTRKTTAIKISTKLLAKAGYTHFAAQKTRQEKYLTDLAEQADDSVDILDKNIFGDTETTVPTNSFVAADEFGNFIGTGNLDFMSILGELWDYEGTYKYRLKNSNSVIIPNPSITILGGTTATEFNRIFPQEAIGQGFFSRLLIIYDEPTDSKYHIPPTPNIELEERLLTKLADIKETLHGTMLVDTDASKLLKNIYHTWKPINDSRFGHYSNRRQSHLIKLSMVIAASRCSINITSRDIIEANTILTVAEHFMPKALGEFGKGKHSGVAHKVLQLLDSAYTPVSFREIWQHVHTDLDNRQQLADVMINLKLAGKIQDAGDKFLPVKSILKETKSDALDWSILRNTEKSLIMKDSI